MKEKYEYKKATIADIDELVRTRMIVLRAANKLSDDEDMSTVEKESYAYYKRALETAEHIAYLVYDNGTFIGAGGVSFYQVMPTYHNPTGKKAYIMNMYRNIDSKKLQFDFVVDWDTMAYGEEVIESGSKIHYIPAKSKQPIKQITEIIKRTAQLDFQRVANIDKLWNNNC